MEWLKNCSIDYLREGLSDILIDNGMDLPWPCRARGNTTPEATLCPMRHCAHGGTLPDATLGARAYRMKRMWVAVEFSRCQTASLLDGDYKIWRMSEDHRYSFSQLANHARQAVNLPFNHY